MSTIASFPLVPNKPFKIDPDLNSAKDQCTEVLIMPATSLDAELEHAIKGNRMTPSLSNASRGEHSSLKRMDSELPNSTFDEEESRPTCQAVWCRAAAAAAPLKRCHPQIPDS